MLRSFSNRIFRILVDWLIALLISSLILWFLITQPLWINKSQEVSYNVDIAQIKSHVQLLTEGYAPRTINYNNLNDTADYIYRELAAFGEPEYQFINTISQKYRNVSLQLGPDTEEVYVLGAHYDAKDDSIDSEGNASGVATLIELAHRLSEYRKQLDIGVILIAYPLSLNQLNNNVNTGSYTHAKLLRKQNKKVRLMISLDGVGQKNSFIDTTKYPNKLTDILYPSHHNSVNLIGRLKDFNNIRELKKEFNSSSSLLMQSHNLLQSFNKSDSNDHENYWKHGYPAALISDKLNLENTKTFESSVEPKDRLDYEKIAKLVNGLSHVILQTQPNTSDRTRLVQRQRDVGSNSQLY